MDVLLITGRHGRGGCVVDHWVSWGEVYVFLIGCQWCSGCVVDHWVSWGEVDVLLIGCQG